MQERTAGCDFCSEACMNGFRQHQNRLGRPRCTMFVRFEIISGHENSAWTHVLIIVWIPDRSVMSPSSNSVCILSTISSFDRFFDNVPFDCSWFCYGLPFRGSGTAESWFKRRKQFVAACERELCVSLSLKPTFSFHKECTHRTQLQFSSDGVRMLECLTYSTIPYLHATRR
jgi:hypothetical protein